MKRLPSVHLAFNHDFPRRTIVVLLVDNLNFQKNIYSSAAILWWEKVRLQMAERAPPGRIGISATHGLGTAQNNSVNLISTHFTPHLESSNLKTPPIWVAFVRKRSRSRLRSSSSATTPSSPSISRPTSASAMKSPSSPRSVSATRLVAYLGYQFERELKFDRLPVSPLT